MVTTPIIAQAEETAPSSPIGWCFSAQTGVWHPPNTSAITSPATFPQVKASSLTPLISSVFWFSSTNRKMQSSSSRPHLPHLLTAAPESQRADYLTPGCNECNAAATY